MKHLLYILILLAFFVSCKEKTKEGFVIDGKIKNLSDSTILIVTQDYLGESMRIDTVFASNEGKFVYEGFSDSLTSVIIYMEKGVVWTTIWVENQDKLTLSGDVNYPELILANGNEVNNLLAQFKNENERLLEESRNLLDRKDNFDHDSLSTEINNTQYESKLSNIFHQLKEKAEDFIKAHPTSIASLVLLQDYLADSEDPVKLDEYLSIIDGEATNDSLYKKLVNLNDRLKSTTIGSIAPDFSLIDLKKDTITLEKFKGKYLLLSFAASWCEPCRDEAAEYVKIRKKYNDKKLSLLTISIDDEQSSWENFVNENKFSWPQVVDIQGWESSIISLYNVTFIPSNFLLDENNVIIAKNLPMDSLLILLEGKLN